MTVTPPAPVHVALIQIKGATGDKNVDCDHMGEMVLKAVREGEEKGARPHIVVLPEMWNSILSTPEFTKASEPVPEASTPRDSYPDGAYTCTRLSKVAEEANVWLIGGSIPERRGDKMHNCATVYDNSGHLVAVYRKLHMFDLCLPTMTYRESDQFTPGDKLCSFETPFGKFGLALCYDIRFPELAAIASKNDCIAMFYPAAFNCVTGPLHWELLQRSRALDNQMFVATCSPSRDENAAFVVYGHTMASSPMGQVIASVETAEAIVHTTFDPQAVFDARAGIPLRSQRRFDLYADIKTAVPPKALSSKSEE